MSSADGVIAELQRVAEMVEPKIALVFNPLMEERVLKVAGRYQVRLVSSDYIPEDRIYLIDLGKLPDIPEPTFR